MSEQSSDLRGRAAEGPGGPQGAAASSAGRGNLSTLDLVVMVAGTQVPLGSVVALVPVAIGFGVGVGAPVAWAFAGLILLAFAVGWSRMAAHVTNTGAFYAFISHGLGLPLGAAGAAIAMLAYNALAIAAVAILGSFAGAVVANLTGLSLSWEVYAFATVLVIGLAAAQRVDLSARLLLIAVAFELVLLGVLAGAILWHQGLSALPMPSFDPSHIFAPGVGVTMAVAVWVSLGFEAAAVYGEEARDPRRSVPRASYLSILLITLLYVTITWIVIAGAATGPDGAGAQEAAAADPADMIFGLYAQYTAPWLVHVVEIWSILSIIAACLGCHNLAARYFFVLGRERILPEALGRLSPKTGAPWTASLTQLILMAVILGAFALAGTDPYLVLGSGLLGVSVMGIVLLMAVASIAVFWFFRTQAQGGFVSTFVLPLLSCAGMILILVLVALNYGALSGFSEGIMLWVPALIPLVGGGTLLHVLRLKRSDPARYAAMRRSLDRL